MLILIFSQIKEIVIHKKLEQVFAFDEEGILHLEITADDLAIGTLKTEILKRVNMSMYN